MLRTFRELMSDDSGATAIEYGLIAALVGVALVGGLNALSGGLDTLFTDVGNQLAGSAGEGGGGGGGE